MLPRYLKNRANIIHRPSQGATFTLSGPQERHANSRFPDFCSLSLHSRPLQNAKQKPLLRMNSMENKTSFMKSVVYDCQVDQRYWNYDIIHLVRKWWSVDAEPRLAADLLKSGFKAQHKRSSVTYVVVRSQRIVVSAEEA